MNFSFLHQSQKTQAFCVADFATLSDERRSRSKIFLLFIWIKNLALENLKGSHVRNFLGFRKLTSQDKEIRTTKDHSKKLRSSVAASFSDLVVYLLRAKATLPQSLLSLESNASAVETNRDIDKASVTRRNFP